MSTIPPISADSEKRLTTALEEAYVACLDGASPDAALAKAAAAHDVPSSHVPLLVYAYNTGRAEQQRAFGKTATERMSSFLRATAAGVLQAMAPEGVRRQRALEKEDPDYAAPPKTAARTATKTAADPLTAPNDTQHLKNDSPRSNWRSLRSGRWAAGWKERDEAKQRAQKSQFDMREAFDRMIDKNAALVGYFRRRDARPLEEVRAHAVALFGKHASTILDGVADRVPAALRGPMPLHPAPGYREQNPYNFIDAIIKAAQEYVALQEQTQYLQKLAADADVLLQIAVRMERGEDLDDIVKEASFLPGFAMGAAAVQDAAGRLPLQKSLESLRTKALQKITDPAHESQLRNVQVQTMLSDLLANDEVLSGHDPAEVLGHYNEIAQLGPRISTQPAVVRALLRRRLQQGSPDPFELDLQLKMENNLRNRDRGSVLAGGSDDALSF